MALLALALCACDDGGVGASRSLAPDTDAAAPDAAVDDAAVVADAEIPDAILDPPAPRATVAHDFGERELDPFEEVSPCVQWTLNNTEPLYIEGVSLANGGGFHHSNWFVVPEDAFPGRDGYFRCGRRDFNEIGAALRGTVLFAQSTQSYFEEQRLGEGIVIRVPPGYKVIGSLHLLNLAAAPVTTHLHMRLDLVHPTGIETIVTPFRYSYLPLEIPPLKAAHFTADCNLREAQERRGLDAFNFKVHWLLPHYHALGNYFDVTVRGGRLDGESIMRLDQFNAEPNGKHFDPPLDLSDADGLAVTCGYDNPTRQPVGWGIGDQEMCVMLGFAEADVMMDASVLNVRRFVEESFGVEKYDGDCIVLTLDKSSAHAPPTAEELEGELYLPPSDDIEVVGRPDCVDTPAEAEPTLEPTLENVSGAVFTPSCNYSACHGGARPAAGLRLDQTDLEALRAALLEHEVASTSPLPLVAPGDPAGSLLYERLAKCDPDDGAHMPLNAPQLLPPGRVALVRDWIASQ